MLESKAMSHRSSAIERAPRAAAEAKVDAGRRPDDLLTTPQVAGDYPISKSWLAHARLRGDGPKFHRWGGKVLYRRSAIKSYLEKREFVSTSQVA